MAREFTLSVVGPDAEIVRESVVSLVAPGTEGYFGVMGGHVPLVAALRPGIVEYADLSGNRHSVYIGGGFCEVGPDAVTVLADEARRAVELDAAQAEADLAEARRALRGEESSISTMDAVEEIERATARLRAARAVR